MVLIAPTTSPDRTGTAILMMLGAYFLFSFLDLSVKWLLLAGFHSFQMAFMRYFGNFVVALVLVIKQGNARAVLMTDHLGAILFRSSMLISATVLNFVALTYLQVTTTSAILFSAPIIVCLLSMPMLGERVGPWRWFAIGLGFSGVLIVIRPFGEAFHWAMLLSVWNAFAMALYSILTRRLSASVASNTLQFYMGGLGSLALAPFAIGYWVMPDTPLPYVLLAMLGVWGYAGHELLTHAHRLAPANVVMPYTYSFMIYLTIGSYLIFAHVPDGMTVIGALVIVVSGLLIWIRENKRKVQSA